MAFANALLAGIFFSKVHYIRPKQAIQVLEVGMLRVWKNWLEHLHIN